jgi:hypothetical protein
MLKLYFDDEKVKVVWGDGPSTVELVAKNADVEVNVMSRFKPGGSTFWERFANPIRILKAGWLSKLMAVELAEGTNLEGQAKDDV